MNSLEMLRQDPFGAGPQPNVGRDAPAPSAQLPPAVRQRLEAREARDQTQTSVSPLKLAKRSGKRSAKTKWKALRNVSKWQRLHAPSIIFDPRVSQEARRAQRSRDVSSDREVSERYGLPAGY